MNPINNIPGFPQGIKRFEKDSELDRVKTKKETGKGKIFKSKDNKRVDEVEISTIGKNLLQQNKEISRYLNEIKNIETKSQKELQNIQQKVADDFFSKPEVLDKIIESILELPSFQNLKKGNAKKNSKVVLSKLNNDRLQEIQQKIDKGDYNTEEVINVIAEHLLNSSEI